MKIVMMGAGGVGGLFGGLLAHAGCDVNFIARGRHLAAMQEHGLSIESEAHGNVHIANVQATDDPAALGTADLVIVSVKLGDSEAAAELIKPVVGPDTAVLSLQNGVLKDELSRETFGERAVMGGVAYVGAYIGEPGVIHQIGAMQRIVHGEYDGTASPRAKALHEALQNAGIDSEISADIRRSIWQKYVFLVGLSAATTAMRVPLGPIRDNPRARAFFLQLMREVVAVGRAHGVDLAEDYPDERLEFADTLPAAMDSSMHHDLQTGRPLEVNWLSGGVVKLGRDKGIATPANGAVCDILAVHAKGQQ